MIPKKTIFHDIIKNIFDRWQTNSPPTLGWKQDTYNAFLEMWTERWPFRWSTDNHFSYTFLLTFRRYLFMLVLQTRWSDMQKQIRSITNPGLSLNVLDSRDVQRIHTATLDVIESTGVRFPSKKAQDIWKAHGADVDPDTMIVRVPGRLIEDALKHAPPAYTLAARDAAQDLPLDGNHVYAGTDGCGVEIIDKLSGKCRRTRLRDVAEIARVADGVEEIAFHFAPVSAQDYPPETRGLHELAAIWKNSTKHVQTESVYSEREALASVEMAAAIAGGRAALRQRPVLSIMECTISPLAHDGGSIDAALIAAEAGVPVGFMTMASCASTAPATPAGSLLVGNAEVISAMALIRRLYGRRPGRFSVRRSYQPPGRFLRRAAVYGLVRHRRQTTQLAGRHREQPLHIHGLGCHVRHAAGSRPAQREQDMVLRADDHGL